MRSKIIVKNALKILSAACSLFFCGCMGFTVFCVQNTIPETDDLEITTFKIHYVTQDGEVIEIYTYEKKEEDNANNDASKIKVNPQPASRRNEADES